jgi:two-component system phosphate regulon sensor histidine kinase PhoR
LPKKIVGILTESLVDQFDEACIGIDKEGRIHFINVAAGALFGVSPQALLGEKIWDALEMTDFTRSFVRVVKEGETAAREQLVVMPDQRALQASFLPIRAEAGRLVGAVAVIRDVTSIRRIEKDVSTLVSRISEELKIPLTSIKGYVETLLEGAYTEPEILRRFLQIINEETNRMARLLVGLMDAGETRSAADAPMGPVRLGPVVRETAGALAPLAQQKRLELVIDLADSLPPVRGNLSLLRQAVTNLLDNAIKVAGLNAEIGLAPGRVRLALRAEGQEVALDVEDNGPGLEPAEQERVFERFYRVTSGPTAQLGGTGLGLSIAREIATACGGKVTVQSVPGRGATFQLRLPLAE